MNGPVPLCQLGIMKSVIIFLDRGGGACAFVRLLFEVLVCLSRLLAAIFAKEKRSREQAHLIHEPVLGIPKKALVRDYRAALLRDWPAGGCFLSDNRKASQSSPIHGMQQFEYPALKIALRRRLRWVRV